MQDNDNPPPTLKDLLALETDVWRALQTGDRARDLAALSAHFIGVYPSGISDRAGHADQVSDGPSVADFTLSEARIQVYTNDLAMLIYRAAFRRPDQSTEQEMYVSSLWQRTRGRWQNQFSQDTPVSR